MSMVIEFSDGRRKPVVIDYEMPMTDEELLLELWAVRMRKAVLVLNSIGLLSKVKFRKSRILTD